MNNALASLVNLCRQWEPRVRKHREEKEGLVNPSVLTRYSKMECLLKCKQTNKSHLIYWDLLHRMMLSRGIKAFEQNGQSVSGW